jgi:hypothetical protein
MVAAGVGLVLTLVLTRLMIATSRSSEQTQVRTELQQSAVLALRKIAADVGSSSPQGLTISPTTLGIHPIKSIDAGGHTTWSDEAVLYAGHLPEKSLVRALRPVAAEEAHPLLLSPTVIDELTLSLPKRQSLIDDLAELRFSAPVPRTATAPGQPLKLWVKLAKAPRNGKPIEVQLEQVVSMRMGAN